MNRESEDSLEDHQKQDKIHSDNLHRRRSTPKLKSVKSVSHRVNRRPTVKKSKLKVTKKKTELDSIIKRNLYKEFSANEIDELGLDEFGLGMKKKKKPQYSSNYYRNRNDVNMRKIRFRYN